MENARFRYAAYPDQVMWTEFDGVSAVFDSNSGATHVIIPDQLDIYTCAAKQPFNKSTLLDQLIAEYDHETDSDNDVRETLSVRVDELIALGLLRPVK